MPGVKLLTGDLTDLSSLMRAFGDAEPDEVYNLGAISFVAYSWENARLTSEVTGLGVLNLLEATRLYAGERHDQGALLPGVELGDVRQGAGGAAARDDAAVAALALRRGQGLRPLHDDQLPRVLRHARLVRACCSTTSRRGAARSSSPARSARPSRGSRSACRPNSSLGNLDAKRDWGFAGDYVEAMWLMLQQDEADDYVVATGETHSIREFLDVAFRRAGIDDWEKYVVQDPRFFRPAEVDLLVGDPAKAKRQARLDAAGQLRRSWPR